MNDFFRTFSDDASLSHPGGLELTKRMIRQARLAGWLHKKAHIIDLGCGGGNTVSYLNSHGYYAVGVDSTPPLDSPDLIIGDASALPWPDDTFDCAITEFSLSSIGIEKAVPEIRRVLKPGGILFISDLFPSGLRPSWTEKYGFQVLHLENDTSYLKTYLNEWITRNPSRRNEAQNLFLDDAGYYSVIMQKNKI